MNKRRSKLVLKTKPNRMLSIASKINLIYFRFEGDTCTALEDFQQDPYNSSLSSILPCNELLSAKSVLSDVGAGIYDLVNEVKLRTEIFVLFFGGTDWLHTIQITWHHWFLFSVLIFRRSQKLVWRTIFGYTFFENNPFFRNTKNYFSNS